jgi:hypothetical protein
MEQGIITQGNQENCRLTKGDDPLRVRIILAR